MPFPSFFAFSLDSIGNYATIGNNNTKKKEVANDR